MAKDLVKSINSLRKGKAQAKLVTAQAKIAAAQAKAIKTNAKANLMKEKQALSKTRARAAALSTSIGSIASSRASVEAAKAGLGQWNSIINANPEPVEGTGDAKPGSGAGTGETTGTAPVGNY